MWVEFFYNQNLKLYQINTAIDNNEIIIYDDIYLIKKFYDRLKNDRRSNSILNIINNYRMKIDKKNWTKQIFLNYMKYINVHQIDIKSFLVNIDKDKEIIFKELELFGAIEIIDQLIPIYRNIELNKLLN